MNDKESAVRLIESELKRKAARMKANLDNDTWTKRDTPPADWNKPLPEFMLERNKDSYLERKGKELEEEEEREKQELIKLSNYPAAAAAVQAPDNKNSFCTFM